MALQRVRAMEALNAETSSELQFRTIKGLNDPKSSHCGMTATKKNQKEYILLRTALFKHGENKVIHSGHKIVCVTEFKLISQECTFVQVNRGIIIRQYYPKEKLDMGCVRNKMGKYLHDA